MTCKRESIDAHLTVVFAALAISKFIEVETGWSIDKFVENCPLVPWTIEIQAGEHTIIAADPLPDDLVEALNALKAANGHAH